MIIDSINKGVVIDHITAGKGMDIYNYLAMKDLDCSVAIIQNAKSNKVGKKDIIKIEDEINLDFTILGYIDPQITVNIIENGEITAKKTMSLPERIVDVLECKNPRCITTAEPDIPQEFVLADRERHAYRCVYCEQEHEGIG